MKSWYEAEVAFDAELDNDGKVIIAGISFSRAVILRNMDPTAYQSALYDWLDTKGVDTNSLGDR